MKGQDLISLSLNKLLALLLLALTIIFLLLAYLFPFHLQPWPNFYNEWFFGLFVGLCIAVVMLKGRFVWSNPWCWVLAVAAVSVHFVLVGQHGPMAQESLLLYGLYALVAYCAYVLGLNLRLRGWLGWILAVVWVAAMVSALIAVMQWTVGGQFEWNPAYLMTAQAGTRVFSNIGQANNFGTLMVIGVWLVAYAWYQPGGKKISQRLGLSLSLFLLVLGVYVSGSRTAVLNMVLAPVLVALWSIHRKKRPLSLVFLPIAIWYVLYVLMPYAIVWFGLEFPEQTRSLVNDPTRLRMWSMVWASIAEHPWLGNGFWAVPNAHLRFSPIYGAIDYKIAVQAHNTVLDILAMFGLVLGSLMVGLIVFVVWRAWEGSDTAPKQFVWLMIVAMLVHGLLEYPLHYGYFLWLFSLLLGVLVAKPWKTIKYRRPVLWVGVWLVFVFSLAFPFWQGYTAIEKLTTQLRQEGPRAVNDSLITVNPFARTLYPGLVQRLSWLSFDPDRISSISQDELNHLETMAQAYPLPGLIFRTALAYGYRADSSASEWWVERMCKMFQPDLCISAQQEWLLRGSQQKNWPTLPWEAWLPKPATAR